MGEAEAALLGAGVDALAAKSPLRLMEVVSVVGRWAASRQRVQRATRFLRRRTQTRYLRVSVQTRKSKCVAFRARAMSVMTKYFLRTRRTLNIVFRLFFRLLICPSPIPNCHPKRSLHFWAPCATIWHMTRICPLNVHALLLHLYFLHSCIPVWLDTGTLLYIFIRLNVKLCPMTEPKRDLWLIQVPNEGQLSTHLK